jgi:hypothetical protein
MQRLQVWVKAATERMPQLQLPSRAGGEQDDAEEVEFIYNRVAAHSDDEGPGRWLQLVDWKTILPAPGWHVDARADSCLQAPGTHTSYVRTCVTFKVQRVWLLEIIRLPSVKP